MESIYEQGCRLKTERSKKYFWQDYAGERITLLIEHDKFMRGFTAVLTASTVNYDDDGVHETVTQRVVVTHRICHHFSTKAFETFAAEVRAGLDGHRDHGYCLTPTTTELMTRARGLVAGMFV